MIPKLFQIGDRVRVTLPTYSQLKQDWEGVEATILAYHSYGKRLTGWKGGPTWTVLIRHNKYSSNQEALMAEEELIKICGK